MIRDHLQKFTVVTKDISPRMVINLPQTLSIKLVITNGHTHVNIYTIYTNLTPT